MKKLIAVALLAVPLTFAAQAPASSQGTDTAKTKKHRTAKHKKGAKTDTTATTPAPTK